MHTINDSNVILKPFSNFNRNNSIYLQKCFAKWLQTPKLYQSQSQSYALHSLYFEATQFQDTVTPALIKMRLYTEYASSSRDSEHLGCT